MQLLASWKDSLSLFKPSSFKLFMLVTLKSLGDTYKVWLKYCGFLVLLFYVLQFLGAIVYIAPVFMAVGVLDLATLVSFAPLSSLAPLITSEFVLFLIIMGLFLSARPAMGLKNSSYFLGYGKHVLYLMPWFLLLPYAVTYWMMATVYSANKVMAQDSSLWNVWLFGWLAFYYVCMFAVTSFFIQFFFDSNGSLKNLLWSLWSSIKMMVYNFPALVLFSILLAGIYALLLVCAVPLQLLCNMLLQAGMSLVCPESPYALWGVVRIFIQTTVDVLFFLPIFVCLSTNFYVKKVHEQFGIYFK